MKRIVAIAVALPGTAIAEAFDRPIPQPQTAAAEPGEMRAVNHGPYRTISEQR